MVFCFLSKQRQPLRLVVVFIPDLCVDVQNFHVVLADVFFFVFSLFKKKQKQKKKKKKKKKKKAVFFFI